MGEYMFGVGSGKVTAARAAKAEKIAKKHGAYYCGNPDLPGQGRKYWFAKKNEGNPFDQRTEAAVMADLKAAGLFPLGKP